MKRNSSCSFHKLLLLFRNEFLIQRTSYFFRHFRDNIPHYWWIKHVYRYVQTMLNILKDASSIVESSCQKQFITRTYVHKLSISFFSFSTLGYEYKKRLKAFYVVHPTLWTKMTCWWFTTFMRDGIKQKMHNVNALSYLFSTLSVDQDSLELPVFIEEYDMSINGTRYYKQFSLSH